MEEYKIWRYLDFTKFISLLDTKSLFLSRVDQMMDNFEGAYPTAYFGSRNEMYELHKDEINRVKLRKHVAINCWHKNEYGSAAMWSLYLKSDEGVAIQTHVDNLIVELFENTPDEYLPTVGPVRYIDFDLDNPELGFVGAYSLKRKSFEHENEIRAVLCKCDEEWNINGIDEIPETGVSIPVNLNNLIENVYVSPSAPGWFYNLVVSTSKKYGLACEIRQSSLNAGSPMY